MHSKIQPPDLHSDLPPLRGGRQTSRVVRPCGLREGGTIPRLVAGALLLLDPGAEVGAADSTSVSGGEPSAALERVGWRERMAAKGVEFSGSYQVEIIGNVSGGLRQAAIAEGLAKVGIHLDLEKVAGWREANFHASSLYPHGASPSGKLAGDFLTMSNLDAPDSLRLFEVWLEQGFWDGKVSLRAGQLAADEEFAGTDHGGLFAHAATGWPPMISMNAPAPAYPAAAPGVRLEVRPLGEWFARVGVYDGDPDPGDANGEPLNRHGERINLGEGAFIISEAGVGWHQGEEASGYPGTAKVGGWLHTDSFDDPRYDEAGLSLSDPASSGLAATHSGTWGLYLAAEQTVWREKPAATEGLSVFTRMGLNPGSQNFIRHYIEAGVHYLGLIPGREKDAAGIAVSIGSVGRDFGGAIEDANQVTGRADPVPRQEIAWQATYDFVVREGWSIQPSVWFIADPGGSPSVSDAWLIGLRTRFEF